MCKIDAMSSMLSRLMEESCRKLAGARLTSRAAADQERHLRIALVSADVSFAAARSLANKAVQAARSSKSRSPEVLARHLVEILEGALSRPHPSRPFGGRVMLVGPNGAGKTTTAAKLAKRLASTGKVAVLACDHVRPAASEQLEAMSVRAGASFFKLPQGCASRALTSLSGDISGYDHLIFDTAGVQDMVPLEGSPLEDLARAAAPEWKVLVCDASGGQQVANLAEYLSPLGLDASILAKADGDAMGGAALTMVSVTNRPILFVGTGEGVDDLEDFSPIGMASRIMGQGDLASIAARARKVAPSVTLEGKFDFNSMLGMFSAVRSMGGISWVAEMMPGHIGRMAGEASSGLSRVEAIILSMSCAERSNPSLLESPSRILRVARGSGQHEGTVRELVNRLESFSSVLPRLGR